MRRLWHALSIACCAFSVVLVTANAASAETEHSDVVRTKLLIERYQLGEITPQQFVAGVQRIGGSIDRILLGAVAVGLVLTTLAMTFTLRFVCRRIGNDVPSTEEAFWTAATALFAQTLVGVVAPGSPAHMALAGLAGSAQVAESAISLAFTVLVLRLTAVDRVSRALLIAVLMSLVTSGAVLAAVPILGLVLPAGVG